MSIVVPGAGQGTQGLRHYNLSISTSDQMIARARPQGGEGLAAQAAGQRLGGGNDVGGGDLAQVAIVPGPFQQQRVDPVEVHPDGVLIAGRLGPP